MRLHFSIIIEFPAISGFDWLIFDILQISNNFLTDLIIFIIILFLYHLSIDMNLLVFLLYWLFNLDKTTHSLHKLIAILEDRQKVAVMRLLFFNLVDERWLKLFLSSSLDDGHVLKWGVYLWVLESICFWFWLAIVLVESDLFVKHFTIELGLLHLGFTLILLYSLPIQHLYYYYIYKTSEIKYNPVKFIF